MKPTNRFRRAEVSQNQRLYEQLEDRVLFDAVPDGELSELFMDQGLSSADVLAPSTDADAAPLDQPASSDGVQQSPQQQRKEIVFVDESVDNYQQLVADLLNEGELEILFLDRNADGVEQIAAALEGRTGIDTVHIISHGNQAELRLGTATLTSESIDGPYADELAVFRDALAESGDILLYGCNFGEGEAGREATAALAAATGADVAASNDLTGSAALGGDWDLEVELGSIEAETFAVESYIGILGTVISLSDDQGSDTADGVGNGDGGPSFDITEFGVDYANLAAGSIDVHVQVDGDAGVESFVSVLFDIDGDLNADFDYMVTSTTSPVFGVNTFVLYHGANDGNAFKISGKATEVATLDPADTLPMTSTVSIGIGTNPFTGDNDTSFNMTIDLNEIVNHYNNVVKKPSDPSLTYSDVKLLNVATHTSASPTSTTKDQGLADASAPFAINDDGVSTAEDTGVTVDVLANDNRLGYSTVAVNTAPANGTAATNADGTITYTPDANFSGTDTFTYEALAIDGVTHTAQVTVTVAPVADTPTITASDAAGAANTSISLSGSINYSLVDLDGSESLGDITISGAASSLTFSSSSGPVTDNGGGSWTVSQSAIAGLRVTGTTSGTFNLTASVTATDATDLNGDGDTNDASETDTATANDSFVISITALAQPPVLDLNGAVAGVDFGTTYTEGSPPMNIADAAMSLSDPDDTEMSSVAFSISDLLDGDNEVLQLGGMDFSLGTALTQTVSIGGTTFQVVYDGAGVFSITENVGADMPLADIQLLLAGATYQNTSSNPSDGNRTITVTVADPGGTSATATSTVNVDPVNDPPSLDLNGAATGNNLAATFIEGGPAVNLTDTDVAIVNGDDTGMVSLKITPAGIVNGANEILTFNGDGGTSISFGMDGLAAATQQITINGVTLDVAYNGTEFTITSASAGEIAIANAQALLVATSYENATASAIPGDRTLSVSVNDGDADSNIATATITVIPDYLSVSSSKIDTNEDTPVGLGLTIDPDLYSGGPLEDIIGVATGYRADTAGSTATTFTIPDNVTSIVVTGYSNRPNNTAVPDDFNDDYQILSARIDLAAGTSSGTLAHIVDLSNAGSREADQYSWFDAELGTFVLAGGGTVLGDSGGGTNPLFRVVGNTLEVVENHDLQTAYHVEFMTSNRASTNYIGALSDVQQPGDTSSTFTIPAGTNYLVLSENAAAPGSNFRQEYKSYNRIIIDLDTMTASGTIAAEIGETGDRAVAYSFEGYDISASTPGGILGGTSTATIVGDSNGLAAVEHSPNTYINGSGELVVERTASFATDFTSMYTIEAYQRTGFSSIAAIIDTDADSGLFDATNGTGAVNTLSFDVPASTKVGIFRISMATIGGNNENENMGSGFAVIDLENGTSSGSFMNIRTTTPDLVSWSNVPLVDDPGTTGVDERVFFTDPDSVSNRTSLSQFKDGWGGTAWFDIATNIDGTRTVTFNAVSDVGDNAFQDYQAHGQVTWLGNEPFRVRTGAAGGTFSHGSPVLDQFGVPTGEWDIDIEDIPLMQYIPDSHFAGDAFLEIELLSTGEVENVTVCVHPIADTPTLTLNDAPDTNEDTVANLFGSISVALVDADGSEVVSLIEVSSIPVGFVLSDGTSSFSATATNDTVDVTSWNLSNLTLTPTSQFNGTVTLEVLAQTTDTVNVGGTPEVDVTEVTDTNPGEAEATGSFNVTFLPVNDFPVAVYDSDSGDEDVVLTVTAGSGGLLDNDSDLDGDPLSLTGINGGSYTPGTPITLPSGALLTVSADGSYSYDPNGQFESLDFGDTASDSFTYTVDDGNGGTATATVELTVNGVNDAPSGGDTAIATNEDTDYTFTTSDFPFNDVDGDPLAQVRIDSLPTDGTLLLDGVAVTAGDLISAADITAGKLVFRADADENGNNYATFNFSVGDGDAFSSSPSTMTVNVNPVNDNPMSGDDSDATDEDTLLSVAAGSGGLLDNDSDVDGDSLSITQINGSAYTPGTQLTLPSGALLTIAADGSYSYDPNGQLEYLDTGETAADSFTYTIDDGNGGMATATVDFTIQGVNDAPTGGDSLISTKEDTDHIFTPADFPFSDVDLEPLAEVRIDTLPTDGTLLLGGVAVNAGDVIAAADIAAGNFIFRPDANENGTNYASFDFSVGDGDAFVASPSTMTVDVNPINDSPDAQDDAGSTNEDTVVTVAAGSGGLLDNDSDPEGQSLSIVAVNGVAYTPGTQLTLASGALLTINADGSYQYDPNGQFDHLDDGDSLTDTFTYTVSDGNGGVDSATVTLLNIGGANDAPAGTDNGVSTNEDTDYTFSVSDFPFSDVDSSDTFTNLRVDTLPVDGTLLLNGTPVSAGDVISAADLAAGQLVFRPDTDENGNNYATFDFSVGDGDAFADAPSTMNIHVNPVNDNPLAGDDSDATDENTLLNVSAGSGGLLDNDGDIDGDPLTLSSINGSSYTPGTPITLPSGALLMVAADGSYSYDPNDQFDTLGAGDSATDSFTYAISDGNGGTATATVDLIISGVNDAPTSGNSVATTSEDADYTLALSDFPFSDADGDSLAEVRIDSLPNDGTLLLNGTALTAGDVVSAADIVAGKLVFRPDADENGNNYANFDFSVGDGGAFADSPSTLTLDVNPVNDNPVSGADSDATDESTVLNVFAGGGGLLDNDTDVDGDSLSISMIDGVAYTPGAQITLPSGALLTVAADGSYSYDPNGQFESLGVGDTAIETFTYTIIDGDGGTDTATVALSVNGVNDVPVVVNDADTTDEDTPLNVSAGSGGLLDSDDDVDGDTLSITQINGAAYTPGAQITLPSGALLTVAADGSYSYDPNDQFESLDFGDTASDSFTYTVDDGNGGTATATVNLTLIGVEDAPTSGNSTAATTEDTDYTFNTSDFLFSDVDGGDTFTQLRIDTLPADGTLLLDGVAVTAGDLISAADIAAGKLVFQPAADGNGAGYASFDFSVGDGDAFADSPSTMTVNVNPVNDNPVSGADSNATDENTLLSVAAGSGSGLLDNDDDVDGDSLSITQINGAAYTPGTQITLPSGALLTVAADGGYSYDPNGQFESLDDGETAVDSFTYTIDDGNGGTSTAMVDFTVHGVNDGPVGGNSSVTTSEDFDYTLTLSDFPFSDVDGDPLVEVRIDTLPADGTLLLSGVPVSAGYVISAVDIAAGKLVFRPAADGNGAGYASFDFSVGDGTAFAASPSTMTVNVNPVNDNPVSGADSDATDESTVLNVFAGGGGLLDNDTDVDGDSLSISMIDGVAYTPGAQITLPSGALLTVAADGSYSYDPNGQFESLGVGDTAIETFTYTIIDGNGGTDTATVALSVNGVNDVPIAVSDVNSSDEDVVLTVSAGSGGLLDNDSDLDGDPLSLTGINGGSYTPGTPITLPSGALLTVSADGSYSYDPNGQFESLDFGDTASDSFTYTVDDGNGGTATATVELTVNGVNDAPSGGDTAIATNEDTDYTFTTSDFPFNDVDGDPLAQVRIDSLPTDGTLLLDGVAVTAGDLISAADITAGKLVFRADADENGNNYATFNFSVGDGDAFSSSPSTMTVNVNPVNDNPMSGDDSDATDEDTLLSVAAGSGGLLDNDSDVDGDSLSITQINGSAYTPGTQLTLPSGALLTVGADGSYSYDPNGQLEYLDTGETAADSFTYTIDDGNGGMATATVDFTIQGVNDAPTGGDSLISTKEDTDHIFTPADFPFSDVDLEPLAEVRIDTLPTDGTLLLGGVAVNAGDVIAAADIAAGNFIFRPDANENGTNYASFDFSVGDGDAFVASPSTMTVDVNPINDSPDAQDDAGSTNEDTVVTVAAGSGGLLDNDSDPEGQSLSIVAVNGVAYTPGTQLTLASGALLTINADGSYQYDPNGQFDHLDDGDSLTDTFTYTVSDGNGGVDSATVTLLNIGGANDAPAGTDNGVSTNEDTDYTFSVSDFPFSDVDSSDTFTNLRVDTLPVDGTLLLNGTPVSAGDVISAADLAAGQLVFRPDTDENGNNYATFDFSVGDGDAFADAPSTMNIHVNPVNDNPLAGDDSDATDENTLLNVSAGSGGLLDNDGDIDGDPLTLSSINGSSYTPGTPITLPSGALLMVAADGSYSYDPNDQFDTLGAGDSATDSFTYAISDGNGGTNTASVAIAIFGVNDPPVSLNDVDSTDEDTLLQVVAGSNGLLDNDNDVEGDTLSITEINGSAYTPGTQITLPSGALLTVGADGSYGYEPNGQFEQLGVGDTTVDTFTYTVADGKGGNASATVTLTVNGVNDPPTANDDFVTTADNLPITVLVAENDSDPDGDPLLVTLLDTPAAGSATVNADGSITYVPQLTFVGTFQIRYQVEDSSGATSAAVLTIEVTPSFTFDSFNNFSEGHGPSQQQLGVVPMDTERILTKEISSLAPEPIFSGSARPGTQVIGRVYDSEGIMIGETSSYADVGGNWMMQFHELRGTDHARIEFREIAGTSGSFAPIGDIYGYLGADMENNDYAALEPWTPYEGAYDFSAVYRGAAANSLAHLHRLNQTPIGFGIRA